MEGYHHVPSSIFASESQQHPPPRPQPPNDTSPGPSEPDPGMPEWYQLLDTTLDRHVDIEMTTQPMSSLEQTMNPPSSLPPTSIEFPIDPVKEFYPRTPVASRQAEQPKRVSTKHVWQAVLQFLLFHAPSVTVTLSLLILYIRNFSWDPSNEQLSGLLFAARIHEAFIVASLFQILYYHIRRSLLMPPSATGNGISFGFLTSAFQLNSPFYMLSSSFWAPLINQQHGASRISWSSIGFGVLLVVSFVLTALAGASSSVVVLPQKGWYEFQLDGTSLDLRREAKRQVQINPDLGAETHEVPFMGFLVNSTDDLYPSVIDASGLPAKCTEASAPFICPAYNWVGELSVATKWQDANGPHVTNVMNISLGRKPRDSTMHVRHDAFENSRQVVTYKDLRDFVPNPNSIGYTLAAATALLVMIGEILSNEALTWQDVSQSVSEPPATSRPLKLDAKISTRDGKLVSVKQPRVVIQCAKEGEPPSSGQAQIDIPATPNATTNTWSFKNGFYPSMDIEVDNKDVFPYLEYGSVKGPNMQWIDVEKHVHLPANLSVSAAFWLRGYRYMAMSNNYTVCLVDARWMESPETWTMPLQNALLTEHTVPVAQPLAYKAEEPPLNMTLEWLNMLNPKIGDDGATDLFDDIRYQTVTLAMTADTVAILLADALARVVLSKGSWTESSGSPDGDGNDRRYALFDGSHEAQVGNISLPGTYSAASDYALIGLGYYHNAYAYGFKGDGSDTITILCWTVLLLHVVMILGHLVVVFVVNKGWSSDAWAELGELLALTLNSEPPRGGVRRLLENTGAGVKKWRTWRLRTSVREVVDDGGPSGRVEMVLEEPGGQAVVQRRRTMQPDWKYG